MKNYIGVDLGGTNVRAAVIDEEGTILNEKKIPSEVAKGPDAVCDKIIALINEVREGYQVEGIGLGFPGPVNTDTNDIFMASNVPGMAHYPLADKLSKGCSNLPVFIDNDANVAGLAEALLGAGKGKSVVYYTTISTGIGGALVVNGRVVSGKHGFAGEIANIIVDQSKPKFNHLNAGAVEVEASGTGITRKGKALFGDDKINHAGDVFDLARQGNEQALALVDEAAKDYALLFSAISHVVDPYCFVLGGGVMKGKDVFFDKMISYYKGYVHEPMRDVEFLDAVLEEPGIVGAAMLPKSRGL